MQAEVIVGVVDFEQSGLHRVSHSCSVTDEVGFCLGDTDGREDVREDCYAVLRGKTVTKKVVVRAERREEAILEVDVANVVREQVAIANRVDLFLVARVEDDDVIHRPPCAFPPPGLTVLPAEPPANVTDPPREVNVTANPSALRIA